MCGSLAGFDIAGGSPLALVVATAGVISVPDCVPGHCCTRLFRNFPDSISTYTQSKKTALV
jgi:hypothetical protein